MEAGYLMPSTVRVASSKARCAGRFLFINLLSLGAGGSGETNGSPAHFLRAVADARIAEHERVLRAILRQTRRLMREFVK